MWTFQFDLKRRDSTKKAGKLVARCLLRFERQEAGETVFFEIFFAQAPPGLSTFRQNSKNDRRFTGISEVHVVALLKIPCSSQISKSLLVYLASIITTISESIKLNFTGVH